MISSSDRPMPKDPTARTCDGNGAKYATTAQMPTPRYQRQSVWQLNLAREKRAAVVRGRTATTLLSDRSHLLRDNPVAIGTMGAAPEGCSFGSHGAVRRCAGSARAPRVPRVGRGAVRLVAR